jgi:hypothetical protein
MTFFLSNLCKFFFPLKQSTKQLFKSLKLIQTSKENYVYIINEMALLDVVKHLTNLNHNFLIIVTTAIIANLMFFQFLVFNNFHHFYNCDKINNNKHPPKINLEN